MDGDDTRASGGTAPQGGARPGAGSGPVEQRSSPGRWIGDRLVAPQASTEEITLTFAAAGIGAAAALAAGAAAGWPLLAAVVVGVVGFDYFGGAVANATSAAKRHFHGRGRTWRHRLGFAAMHVQPALVAWAVPGFGWLDAAAVYGITLSGAVLVEFTAAPLRRPVAFAAATLGTAAALILLDMPPQVAWLAPVGLVKMLIGHLLPGDGGVTEAGADPADAGASPAAQ